MTSKERAEKIEKLIRNSDVSAGADESDIRDLLTDILAQIREAVEEARQNTEFRGGYHLGDLQKAYQRGKEEGFNAAREQAAEIATECTCCGKNRLADDIRKMEPEG